jgi:hypothetical protein
VRSSSARPSASISIEESPPILADNAYATGRKTVPRGDSVCEWREADHWALLSEGKEKRR